MKPRLELAKKTTKPMTTDAVLIQTAAIEIKTLTLNNKQMTLAVFRQIPYKGLIDRSTGTLNGVAWGWVNYYWDGMFNDRDAPRVADMRPSRYLHVIWQRGNCLYRALIDKVQEELWSLERYLPYTKPENLVVLYRNYSQYQFEDFFELDDDGLDEEDENSSERSKGTPEFYLDCKDALRGVMTVERLRKCQLDKRISLVKCLEQAGANSKHSERVRVIKVEEVVHERKREVSRKLAEQLQEEHESDSVRIRRTRETVHSLSTLPQLFIAV